MESITLIDADFGERKAHAFDNACSQHLRVWEFRFIVPAMLASPTYREPLRLVIKQAHDGFVQFTES